MDLLSSKRSSYIRQKKVASIHYNMIINAIRVTLSNSRNAHTHATKKMQLTLLENVTMNI